MQRTPILSTLFVSVGYDHPNQQLELEFKNGTVYRYQRVPLDIYRGFISSSSASMYFQMHIEGKFRSRQMNEPDPS
jgi:hypothetical protein